MPIFEIIDCGHSNCDFYPEDYFGTPTFTIPNCESCGRYPYDANYQEWQLTILLDEGEVKFIRALCEPCAHPG